MLAKFPIGILIDCKVKSRRLYSIISNIVIAFLNFAIAMRVMDSPELVCFAQFLVIMSHCFIDQSIASYTIEQSRNVPFGVEDIQSYKMFWYGFSSTIGSVFGTLFMHYEMPRLCFGFIGISFAVSAVQTFFLPDAMENNERASILDKETVLFM